MNKFVIENTAELDLKIIFDYISADNESAAKKLVKEFYKTFEMICKHPGIGSIRSDFTYKDVRFYVKKNYIIAYNVEGDVIHILRVLSGYQNICMLF